MTESNMEGSQALFSATGLQASLTASDLPASIRWYRDAVGFEVERQHERDGKLFAARLRAGAVAILLTQDNGAKGNDREKGAGISLRFTTSDPVDQVAERIVAFGHVLESEPTDGPVGRAFRVRDPDGFLLMISEDG